MPTFREKGSKTALKCASMRKRSGMAQKFLQHEGHIQDHKMDHNAQCNVQKFTKLI